MKKLIWILGIIGVLVTGTWLYSATLNKIMSKIDSYSMETSFSLTEIRVLYDIWKRGYIQEGNIKVNLTPAKKDSIKQEVKNYIGKAKANMDTCKMWIDSLKLKLQ